MRHAVRLCRQISFTYPFAIERGHREERQLRHWKYGRLNGGRFQHHISIVGSIGLPNDVSQHLQYAALGPVQRTYARMKLGIFEFSPMESTIRETKRVDRKSTRL